MSRDKAPGPDEFSMAFFSSCWGVIKDEVMCMFHHFHEFMCFEKSLNAAFIVLIPKKVGARELRDYRPISLIGGVYKLLAKVLSLRLRRVIRKVISETQHAFVGERQITDASFIANEVVDARMKSGISGLLCKLDIEKAYNHVNWDFLMYMMERLGFGAKWRK